MASDFGVARLELENQLSESFFPLAAGRPTGVLTAAVHVRRSEHLGPLSTESTDLSLRSYTNEV